MALNGAITQTTWSDSSAVTNNTAGLKIKSTHITELRTAITALQTYAKNVDNCGNCTFCQTCQSNTCQTVTCQGLTCQSKTCQSQCSYSVKCQSIGNNCSQCTQCVCDCNCDCSDDR